MGVKRTLKHYITIGIDVNGDHDSN